jgi:hypothetical protein
MSEGSIQQNCIMKERILHLASGWRSGEIGDAAYASLYFLHSQVLHHGKRFASRKFKQDPRPDAARWLDELERLSGDNLLAGLLFYFERYGFLGVIPNVTAALRAWLNGRWPLSLCEHIPSPAEVLRMQVRATRPVTVLAGFPRFLQPVLKKPNAHAFMVHDLEHAYKFFSDPDIHEGQKRFFSQVLSSIESGIFDDYMRDTVFADKFDYLISDMNTHAMHSLQFLRAILLEYHLRDEGKQAGEILSREARAEIDAVMRWFGGCRDYVFARQAPHPSGISSAGSGLAYADAGA